MAINDIPTARRNPHAAASGLAGESGAAQATAMLRAEHHEETGALQRAVDHVTNFVARPWFAVMLSVSMLLWMGANVLTGLGGGRPPDPPPFAGLQAAVGLAALYVAVLILTSQRRQEELASHREQLALELSIVNDQKVSKMIELLEELRRDSPMIMDRVDLAAATMSTPSDTRTVLDAIKHPAVGDSTVAT